MFKQFSILTYLALIPLNFFPACAQKPQQTPAYGEGDKLVAKSILQGEKSLSELQNSESVSQLVQYVDAGFQNAALYLNTPEGFNLASEETNVKFEITTNYLNVYVKASHLKDYTLAYGFAIDHFDLVPKKNAKGEETRFTGKDQLVNKNAIDRAFVEIKTIDKPIFMQPDNNTAVQFNRVNEIEKQKYSINSAIPGVSEELKKQLVAEFSLSKNSILKLKLVESGERLQLLDVSAGEAQAKILVETTANYVDLVPRTETVNGQYENTPYVQVDTKRDWKQREFLALAVSAFMYSDNKDLYKNLYPKSLFAKAQSFVWNGDYANIPILNLIDKEFLNKNLVEGAVFRLEKSDTLHVEITETSLAFYKFAQQKNSRNEMESVRQNLVLFNVRHVDVVNRIDPNSGEPLAGKEIDVNKRTYLDREFLQLEVKNPIFSNFSPEIRNSQSYVLKADLQGEFSGIEQLPSQPQIRFDLREDVKAAIAKNKNLSGASISSYFVEINKAHLLIYVKLEDGSSQLILTYPISSHLDFRNAQLWNGTYGGEIIRDTTTQKDMEDRLYIEVDYQNPKFFEDQVKPRALKKEVFNTKAEYLYTAMVTEIKSENGVFFPGMAVYSDSRIRFKFTDKYLTAIKTRQALNTGMPVEILKFPAEHFDIEQKRDRFDEPTYQRIENHTDKDWQDREFTRVDLNSNLIPGYFNNLMAIPNFFGQIEVSRRELAEDITVDTNEDGSVVYFDTIETFNLNAMRKGPPGETGYEPSTVKIRHSFIRVDGREKQYQAQKYDMHYLSIFGFFWDTKLAFDENGRRTDDTETMFAQRHDISGGKQIVYYLNEDWPKTKLDLAENTIAQWNAAFKEVYPERNGDIVVLNSTDRKSFADPRYNLLVWLKGHYIPSPAGYGPSLTDPETGEIISARAFYYPDVSLSVAERVKQYIELHRNGCLSTDGEDLRLPPMAALPAKCVRSPILGDGSLVDPATKTIAPFENADGNKSVSVHIPEIQSWLESEQAQNIFQTMDAKANRYEGAGRLQQRTHSRLLTNLAKTSALLDEARDSKVFESIANNVGSEFDATLSLAMLSTPEQKGSVEYEFFSAIDTSLQELSLSSNLEFAGSARPQRLQACVLEHDHNFSALLSFVIMNADKSDEQIVREAVNAYELDVFLHEVGHNMGLTHNFAGSFDRANYPDRFFEIESKPRANEYQQRYMTSSVMDYNQMMEGQISSLGKYDIAAIRFGYKNQIETQNKGFVTRQQIEERLQQTLPANPTFTEYDKALKDSLKSLRTRSYLFCIDWETVSTAYCNRFDRGYSLLDMVQSLVEEYDLRYYMGAFRRGQRDYGKRRSAFETYVLPVRKILDDYLWRKYLFNNFIGASSDKGIIPLSEQDYISAFFAPGFGEDLLLKIMSSVEGTSYNLNKDKGVYEEATAGSGDLTVALDFSKDLYSDYKYSTDRFFYGQLESMGVVTDKIMVILGTLLRGSSRAVEMEGNEELMFFSLADFSPRLMKAVQNFIVDDWTFELPTLELDDGKLLAVDPLYLNSQLKKQVQRVKVKEGSYGDDLNFLSLFFFTNNFDFDGSRMMEDLFDLRIEGVDDQGVDKNKSIRFKNYLGNKTYVVPRTIGIDSMTYILAEKAEPISKKMWQIYDRLGEAKAFEDDEFNSLRRELQGVEADLILVHKQSRAIYQNYLSY